MTWRYDKDFSKIQLLMSRKIISDNENFTLIRCQKWKKKFLDFTLKKRYIERDVKTSCSILSVCASLPAQSFSGCRLITRRDEYRYKHYTKNKRTCTGTLLFQKLKKIFNGFYLIFLLCFSAVYSEKKAYCFNAIVVGCYFITEGINNSTF